MKLHPQDRISCLYSIGQERQTCLQVSTVQLPAFQLFYPCSQSFYPRRVLYFPHPETKTCGLHTPQTKSRWKECMGYALGSELVRMHLENTFWLHIYLCTHIITTINIIIILIIIIIIIIIIIYIYIYMCISIYIYTYYYIYILFYIYCSFCFEKNIIYFNMMFPCQDHNNSHHFTMSRFGVVFTPTLGQLGSACSRIPRFGDYMGSTKFYEIPRAVPFVSPWEFGQGQSVEINGSNNNHGERSHIG